jgi:cytochrome P450
MFNIQLTMRVEDWKPMRTKITPTFSTGKIKTMFDIMARITDNLVDKLSTGDASQANISDTIAMYSTDIISNIAFGLESNCELHSFEFYIHFPFPTHHQHQQAWLIPNLKSENMANSFSK